MNELQKGGFGAGGNYHQINLKMIPIHTSDIFVVVFI